MWLGGEATLREKHNTPNLLEPGPGFRAAQLVLNLAARGRYGRVGARLPLASGDSGYCQTWTSATPIGFGLGLEALGTVCHPLVADEATVLVRMIS